MVVEAVDEAHAQHSGPWDLLFLKGQLAPGMTGVLK